MRLLLFLASWPLRVREKSSSTDRDVPPTPSSPQTPTPPSAEEPSSAPFAFTARRAPSPRTADTTSPSTCTPRCAPSHPSTTQSLQRHPHPHRDPFLAIGAIRPPPRTASSTSRPLADDPRSTPRAQALSELVLAWNEARRGDASGGQGASPRTQEERQRRLLRPRPGAAPRRRRRAQRARHVSARHGSPVARDARRGGRRGLFARVTDDARSYGGGVRSRGAAPPPCVVSNAPPRSPPTRTPSRSVWRRRAARPRRRRPWWRTRRSSPRDPTRRASST